MQNTPTPILTPDESQLKQVKNAAGWIYAIAGLSLVNTVLMLAGSDRQFLVGSAITQVIDIIGNDIGPAGKIIAGVIDLIAGGIVIALGVMASKLKSWAFITTIAIYSIDTLLVLFAALTTDAGRSAWLTFAFHGLAMFYIVSGFVAARKLRKTQALKAQEMLSEPIL